MFDFVKKIFSGEGKTKDPVCGMNVDPKNTEFNLVYQEKEYFFCSDNCKTQFDQNPKQFIN